MKKELLAQILEQLREDTGETSVDALIRHLHDFGDEDIDILEVNDGIYLIGT